MGNSGSNIINNDHFGFLFFGEIPDIMAGIGILLVIGTAVLLYVKARREEKAP